MAFRLTFFLSLLSLALTAQFASPISWSFEQRALGDDRFELTATATAEPGWAIYSQFTDENGPVPTTFYFTKGDHYELIGKAEESGHRKEGIDELFGVNVIKFLSDEPVTFTQTVHVTDYGTPIKGEVEFMCCDDEQCLPPSSEPFVYELAPPAPPAEDIAPAPPAQKSPALSEVAATPPPCRRNAAGGSAEIIYLRHAAPKRRRTRELESDGRAIERQPLPGLVDRNDGPQLETL